MKTKGEIHNIFYSSLNQNKIYFNLLNKKLENSNFEKVFFAKWILFTYCSYMEWNFFFFGINSRLERFFFLLIFIFIFKLKLCNASSLRALSKSTRRKEILTSIYSTFRSRLAAKHRTTRMKDILTTLSKIFIKVDTFLLIIPFDNQSRFIMQL